MFLKKKEKKGKSYYQKGNTFLANENYEEAILNYNKGIALNDKFIQLNYFGRGRTYSRLEKFDLTSKDFQYFLKTEKTNSNELNCSVYWKLASLAEASGQKLVQIKLYEKALNYSPKDKRLKMTYALVLIENNKVQEGVSILDKLIEEDFKNSYLYNNRALGLIKLKEYDKAKVDLDKSLEKDKFNSFIYRNYSYLL